MLYLNCIALHWGPASRKFRSNRITNRNSGYDLNLESNPGVVVYVFNADCHRSCVGLLCTTTNYPTELYTYALSNEY